MGFAAIKHELSRRCRLWACPTCRRVARSYCTIHSYSGCLSLSFSSSFCVFLYWFVLIEIYDSGAGIFSHRKCHYYCCCCGCLRFALLSVVGHKRKQGPPLLGAISLCRAHQFYGKRKFSCYLCGRECNCVRVWLSVCAWVCGCVRQLNYVSIRWIQLGLLRLFNSLLRCKLL